MSSGRRTLVLVLLWCGATAALQLAVRPASAVAPSAAAGRSAASRASRMQEGVPAQPVTAKSAYIEFMKGVPEPVVPDVKLTRSRDGSSGVATFTFDAPSFLSAASADLGETTGMYLKDSEGTLKTTEVTATFVNGKPRIVKGVVVLKGELEWDRFMRFMERYAQANGLGFSKA